MSCASRAAAGDAAGVTIATLVDASFRKSTGVAVMRGPPPPRPPEAGPGASIATTAFTEAGCSSAATQAKVAPSPCVIKIAGPVSLSSRDPLKRHAA